MLDPRQEKGIPTETETSDTTKETFYFGFALIMFALAIAGAVLLSSIEYRTPILLVVFGVPVAGGVWVGMRARRKRLSRKALREEMLSKAGDWPK